MPIIPTIGQKSSKLRMLILGLYTTLMLGSITMMYPFLLMLGVSLSSDYESEFFPVIPAYLHDDQVLFGKYIYEKLPLEHLTWEYQKFPEDVSEGQAWQQKRDIVAPSPLSDWLEDIPTQSPSLEQARAQTRDFDRFREQLPRLWLYAYFIEFRARFDNVVRYQRWLPTTGLTLEHVSTAWGTPVNSFDLVVPPGEDPWRRSYWPGDDEPTQYWERFKQEELEPKYVKPLSLNYAYWYYLKRTPITHGSPVNISSADDYNTIFAGTGVPTTEKFSTIAFPPQRPQCPEGDENCYAVQVWETFVRDWLPVIMARLTPPEDERDACDAAYQRFIQDKYKTLSYYNSTHPLKQVDSFTELEAPVEPPLTVAERTDWLEFMAARPSVLTSTASNEQRVFQSDDFYCDINWISIDAPEYAFHEQLQQQYASLDELNEAWGTDYQAWWAIPFPAPIADQVHFLDDKKDIRYEFLVGNYRDVIRFVATHGRAAWNTLILVTASILTALTVNPMAAYALSRFRLKHSNKILLFLLATMAFPAEVGMIPQFLLLKRMYLLNTYWALILPGLANGFGIFLLKGFFDSLPSELYEAAIMDGASEWRMFFNVTLPLSKPILAVIALQAFGAAYGNFMFAFLVCQDPDKWTLMVFLYELQQYAPPHIIMASLVVTSLPTLIVFIFCQNIILRGIIIPSFK